MAAPLPVLADLKSWIDGLASGGGLESLPRGLLYTVGIALACTLVLLFVSLFAGEIVWMERRIAGRMQARIGPNRVGPQGLLQFLADGVKLLAKEDVIPAGADKPVFLLAPVIVFAGAFVGFAAIPWGYGLVPSDMNLGLFFVLSISSIEVVGVIMAGWASNSKWSVLGAMREVAQVVSYEMPLGISALTVVVLSGSLNLTEIAQQQSGWFWHWYVLRSPATFVGFFIFFTAALAALKRAPFDLPEAESELVAGFHTEYTGFRFAIFFLAEYSGMFLFAILTAVLFFGGWHSGLPIPLDTGIGRAVGALVLFLKSVFFLFVMIWVRWSLPRYRIDKVMYLCYKVLLPWSVVAVVVAALQVLLLGGPAR
jgi:NADH-quinone oxidoreductase subunit H